MPRGVVDIEGLRSAEITAIRNVHPPTGLPFEIRKLGHVVLQVLDVRRSVAFYTQVLGFKVSDVYPDSMMAGKMVSRISSLGLPCDCSGMSCPRSLNLMIAYKIAAKTMRPTMPET